MMKLFCDKCDSLMTEDDSKEVSVLIEFPDRVNHVSEKFTLRRAEGSAGKGADLCRWCLIGAVARVGKKEALSKHDKNLETWAEQLRPLNSPILSQSGPLQPLSCYRLDSTLMGTMHAAKEGKDK